MEPMQSYLQLFFDRISKDAAAERAERMMTLGRLIEILEDSPAEALVVIWDKKTFAGHTKEYPGDEDSYRGYYEDLAFERSDTPITVKEFLRVCERAMGREYEGYKGGDFIMHQNTPLWSSCYRCASGDGIIDAVYDKETKEFYLIVHECD